MKSIQRRKSNPRPQKAARWHSSGFGRRKRLDFWKCCLTYSGLTEKIEYMKIDILWFCSLFLLNKVFMLTWLMLIGGRDSQVLNLSQHQKIQWIKRTLVLLLASFVSILSCWNFDVLIFQFFQCFLGLHKQRGERRLPYYHVQYLNPMHVGKHGFLTFFFKTFLVSSTPTSLLWTPEAWFKTCQAISDWYYMLFNVSNPSNCQCLQAAAAKLSSLFRRSSGRQCSLTRQDISLSHFLGPFGYSW